MKNYLLLCGGVGGAKLALGFSKIIPASNLTILVNTGDDFEHLNLKVCPDLDTVIYTLAGLADLSKGWGRADETWQALKSLGELGAETWFQLGDQDIATHLRRTHLISKGATLTEAIQDITANLKIDTNVLPMSDDLVETLIHTEHEVLAFQEYFVKFQCQPKIKEFSFKGIESAALNPALDLNAFDEIIICPSNPYVSINPIIQLKELNNYLVTNASKVSVVSPIVDSESLKGPTSKMMKELDVPVTVETIASFYANLASKIFIDPADLPFQTAIETKGFSVFVAPLVMNSLDSKIALANEILDNLERS